METKHKRKSPCHRSQSAGLKLKMDKDSKLQRSLVWCSKTHQQQRLREERKKTEALEEQLEAQKLINEELLQRNLQLQKTAEVGKVNEQKVQKLEEEKILLQTKLLDQEEATRELIDELTEEKLRNLDIEQQLHRCTNNKVKVKHERKFEKLEETMNILQKSMAEKNQEYEAAEKKSKETIASLEESTKDLTHKLCEEKNTSLMLETTLHEQKLTENEAYKEILAQEQIIEELMECVTELLLKLNEEKEISKQLNEKALQEESKLKNKEEYIRLLRRDICNRETLFKDHLRVVNEKMEKKSVTCRQLKDQLKEEKEKSQPLENLAIKLMEERERQTMEEKVPETKKPHWKRVRSLLTPDFYRHWVKKRRSQEKTPPQF